jgi:predicted site-specific integrase-resolvase
MNDTVLLTPTQVADRLHVSTRTLERWRCDGYGPPYRKLGRKVVYEQSELNEWCAGKRYECTSAYEDGSHSVGLIVCADRGLG